VNTRFVRPISPQSPLTLAALADDALLDRAFAWLCRDREARLLAGHKVVAQLPQFSSRATRYRVNRRAAAPHQPLSPHWRAINRARSRTRARGEHPFHVVKRLWGFTKVRYRGIAKNLARALSLFALANLYLVRRQLLPPQATCVL
jgi:IS5 family transposase